MTNDGGALHDSAKAFRGRKRAEYMHPVRAQPGSHKQIGSIGIAMLQHPGSLQHMRHAGDQGPGVPVIRISGTQPIGEIIRAAVIDPVEAKNHLWPVIE